ncbi:MAG: phage Gp37/Gp68 family protein [Deltaproteobacteria bacterium]|nr:phage Gp37/Gp68 family protein [Deltaproteobacteria bacterium]
MTPTTIEWATDVWNPVTGCTKVSAGCLHCYAEGVAGRFWGERQFADVRCHPERLNAPLRRRKPARVFVNSMSDLFHPDVPKEFINQVFAVMSMASQHTFMILTKRPERMLGYVMNPPRNVWLGVSIEDQNTADQRIPILLSTPAAVRFVSVEPMLGPVDLYPRLGWLIGGPGISLGPIFGEADGSGPFPDLDWVILGGESGPGARPMDPEWARSVRDQCAAGPVPFFFKQMSGRAPIPPDLYVREYPVVADVKTA